MGKPGLDKRGVGLRPLGSVSIDCDGLVDYARGYGFPYEERENIVLTRGLARLLDLLAEAGIRGTIFLIGRDLERAEHVELFRRALEAGHELANHTWSHPRQLTGLSRGEQGLEIRRTHRWASERLGVEMRGFRAPCYDVDGGVWEVLRELRYEYDSSVNPTPMTLAMELAVWVKSGLRELELRPSYWRHLRARCEPHEVNGQCGSNGWGPGRLIELPLSVWSAARLPVASTWDRMTGMRLFRAAVEWLAERGLPLNYHFHAVDLVGFAEDGVDARFGRHPGMRLALEKKREMVRTALGAFKERFRLVTLVEMARGQEGLGTRDKGVGTSTSSFFD